MPQLLRNLRLHVVAMRSILLFSLLCGAAALLVHGADSGNNPATPVFSVRELELKPGINPSNFEQFVRGELASTVAKSAKGTKIELLKGDRGQRKGGYILMWEFDSVATRNQCFPREGGGSGPAFEEAWARIKPVMGKFRDYVKEQSGYTDYVLVSP